MVAANVTNQIVSETKNFMAPSLSWINYSQKPLIHLQTPMMPFCSCSVICFIHHYLLQNKHKLYIHALYLDLELNENVMLRNIITILPHMTYRSTVLLPQHSATQYFFLFLKKREFNINVTSQISFISRTEILNITALTNTCIQFRLKTNIFLFLFKITKGRGIFFPTQRDKFSNTLKDESWKSEEIKIENWHYQDFIALFYFSQHTYISSCLILLADYDNLQVSLSPVKVRESRGRVSVLTAKEYGTIWCKQT